MLHILEIVGIGIGIALLCILLILAVLLLALLFVPIRYDAAWERTEAGIMTGRVRVSWLLRIISCFAAWEGRLHYSLKIFGIPVYDNLRKRKKEKNKRRTERCPGDRRERRKEEAYRTSGKPPEEEKAAEKRQHISGAQPVEEKPEKEKPEEGKAEERKAAEKPEEEKLAGRGRIRALPEKIRAFFLMLYRLVRKMLAIPHEICDRLRHIKETAEAYRVFLAREDFQRAFALCRRQMFRVLRNIKPRRIKADIHFGFADPSITGQVLSAAGMLYPILGKDIVLRPDFEETVCVGKARLRGRLTLAVLLRALWVLYFNRDVKRLIRIWQKEEALHGRQ